MKLMKGSICVICLSGVKLELYFRNNFANSAVFCLPGEKVEKCR